MKEQQAINIVSACRAAGKSTAYAKEQIAAGKPLSQVRAELRGDKPDSPRAKSMKNMRENVARAEKKGEPSGDRGRSFANMKKLAGVK